MTERYRKKPVVIDAIQWTPANVPDRKYESDFFTFMRRDPEPTWRTEGIGAHCVIYVKTLEGEMRVDPGDFIIRGVHGEVYPCKPDIFTETYERVQETP